MPDPIIIAGVTDTGMRYAQLWHPEFKVVSSLPPAPYLMAWMRTDGSPTFAIDADCPTPWIDIALRMFATFRSGDLPTPTHTQSWKFSQPIFTPIAPSPREDDALFALESEDHA